MSYRMNMTNYTIMDYKKYIYALGKAPVGSLRTTPARKM